MCVYGRASGDWFAPVSVKSFQFVSKLNPLRIRKTEPGEPEGQAVSIRSNTNWRLKVERVAVRRQTLDLYNDRSRFTICSGLYLLMAMTSPPR